MSETNASASDCAHEDCEREASDEDYCYWHRKEPAKDPLSDDSPVVGKIPADLSEAYLYEADLSDADLLEADLSEANLQYADLSKAYLEKADLSEADLLEANLSEADLQGAEISGTSAYQSDMSDIDARGARFVPSPSEEVSYVDLEDAILENADLRGARFTNARLYQTDFTNAQINAKTTFDADTGATIYERDRTLNSNFDDLTETNAEAGAWVHRRLERLHEDNALSESAREFHIRKQEAERRHHRWSADGFSLDTESLNHWGRWIALTLSGGLTRHGESLWRVVVWSVVVIITAAVLYPLVGGFYSDARERRIQLLPGDLAGPAERVDIYWQSLYFSVITFSTIGYGDLAPRGVGSQVLVGLESLAGAVLVALFIFVLGRRTAR